MAGSLFIPDWMRKPAGFEKCRAKTDDHPEVLYMEAAGDSCSEFFFHSRRISSMSKKSRRV